MVNLAESRVTWELGHWTYLGGGVLITLIEMRRSSHRGCHHSCTGILGYVNQEESWAWIHLSLLPNCAFILLKSVIIIETHDPPENLSVADACFQLIIT